MVARTCLIVMLYLNSLSFFGGRCCPNRTRPLRFEVSKSHTVWHIHRVGPLRAIDHNVAEVATYTTCNKHKRRSSMPSAGFEPAIPSTKRLHMSKRPHDHRYRHLFLRTVKSLLRNLGIFVDILFYFLSGVLWLVPRLSSELCTNFCKYYLLQSMVVHISMTPVLA